jgi:hypothetical protein
MRHQKRLGSRLVSRFEETGVKVGRFGKSKQRLILAALGVAGALVFGGCDWPMFGYDAALTHSSPDTAINSANVSTLKPLFDSAGQFTSPVESNGVIYVGGTSGNLYAFDANGNQLWTGSTGLSADPQTAPAVANGVVYIVATQVLSAFDANGVTNCSGTPKVCTPLWSAELNTSSGYPLSSPNVTGGVVYVGGDTVDAFDAKGVTNCSPTTGLCQPLWQSTPAITSGVLTDYTSAAVANGVLYASDNDDRLYAFSANGTTNCSGTPTTCNPLWTATMGTARAEFNPSSPAVSNGVVYDESNEGKLFAFDANGVTNCSGTPTTCSPLWTDAGGATSFGSAPAVANGIVYARGVGGFLDAFDAKGVTNCSGTPKTCTPLWTYNGGGFTGYAAVADGLVFTTGGSGLVAFDANGVTNCSGTPTVCNPLWTGATASPVLGSPAVANGKVYISDNTLFGTFLVTALYGWVLPPPTTTVGIPSNNATVTGLQHLDSSASPGVTQVQYVLTGGILNHKVIATGTPTVVGWLTLWDSTTVPNGVYTLQSVASYGGEVSGTSAPITITVSN